MKQPLVHVLVINWNGRDHVEECFGSLLAGAYSNARFILIDNGSTDDSVALVRSKFGGDRRVEILELGENLGWSRGNNVGIRRAIEKDADYIFLLNNDTNMATDAIENLVAMAESDSRLGALAPKMLMYDNPGLLNSVGLECSIIGSSWDLGIGRLDGPRWSESVPVIGVCGGAAFFRVAALKEAGVLPQDFEIYLDDLDLCLRIWNAGYEIRSCPGARVRHKFSATMGQGKHHRRKYYLNTRNRFYVMLRNFPVRKALRVAAACLVGEMRAVGRALLDGEAWCALAHVRAWGGGAAYVPRAVRERTRRARTGLGACRFWHLVRTDRMFFHGTEFPVDGWYAAHEIRGETFRPMSAKASVEVEAGMLRVTLVNCYPALGQVCIEVLSNGHHVASLETLDRQECLVEVAAGRLTFTAKRIFEAEKTGANVDLGGWVRIDRT